MSVRKCHNSSGAEADQLQILIQLRGRKLLVPLYHFQELLALLSLKTTGSFLVPQGQMTSLFIQLVYNGDVKSGRNGCRLDHLSFSLHCSGRFCAQWKTVLQSYCKKSQTYSLFCSHCSEQATRTLSVSAESIHVNKTQQIFGLSHHCVSPKGKTIKQPICQTPHVDEVSVELLRLPVVVLFLTTCNAGSDPE